MIRTLDDKDAPALSIIEVSLDCQNETVNLKNLDDKDAHALSDLRAQKCVLILYPVKNMRV